jgi:3-oxoacyl-[acyl-carrier protein] reductase
MDEKRIAIVVGASGEIGSVIADRMENAEFRVWRIWHRNVLDFRDSLQVRELSQIESAAEHIFQQCGRIDCLVNASGMVLEDVALNLELEKWRDAFLNNLDPAFLWSKAAAKFMLLNRYGRIIHLSSIAASYGGRGEIAYASSKSAIETMVRILALELGRRNITVNAIAPGVIESKMTDSIRREHGPELLARIAARRIGKTQDVAAVVQFLASEEAGYINGQTIAVDGGMGLG